VTHDQIEAMSMGDKVGVLNDGRIAQIGTPYEIYNNPRDVFVASFVGSPAMNLAAGELANGRVSTLSGKLDTTLAGEAARDTGGFTGPVRLGIRAEDVMVGPDQPVEAKVHHVENHGVEQIVTLRVDEHLFKATVPATMRMGIEDSVKCGWSADKIHVFDADTGVGFAYREAKAA
ncbi:MAG: ABC transporter ATP-binding protein, partial [Bauldia sp.]|nr:ABC transporter ATP-binding protein [Bauldia sp.]